MPSHPAHPPVWRPVSWAGLGDPPRVLPSVPTEEGGEPSKLETHWCGGKRRGRSRAATARKRPQGRSGAQMGAPWRQSEEQPQCKAISAGGPVLSGPPCLGLLAKSCLGPTPTAQEAQVPGALGGDRPGWPRADTASVLG